MNQIHLSKQIQIFKESRIPALLGLFLILLGVLLLLGLVQMTPSKSASLSEIPLDHRLRAFSLVLIPLIIGFLIWYKRLKIGMYRAVLYLVFCLIMSVSIGFYLYGLYSSYFYEPLNHDATPWEMIDYLLYVSEIRRKASVYTYFSLRVMIVTYMFITLLLNDSYRKKGVKDHQNYFVFPKQNMPIEEEKDL